MRQPNSIPGIGEKIAATIISEIGEIDRFNDPKKLIAFAELILEYLNLVNSLPLKIESLKEDQIDLYMPCIWLFVVPFVIVVKKTTDEIIPRNKRMREFFDKKREEGKPFKVAVIACVNKFLHWIFAL